MLVYSSILTMEANVPPKHRLTFNELHGVISQKIELFIATTLRTTNPTKDKNITTQTKTVHHDSMEECT
jgi:hypothetical protein